MTERYQPKQADDLLAALASPNLATRAAAILRLQKTDASALKKASTDSEDKRLRSRAIFALASLGEESRATIAKDLPNDPELRVAAIRALATHGDATLEILQSIANDKSPAVRREALLALRKMQVTPEVQELILELALQYDGHDRYYLEAARLAMSGDAKAKVREQLLQKLAGRKDATAAGWLWSLDQERALKEFSQTAADANAPLADRVVAAEWLALFDKSAAGEELLTLIEPSTPPALAKPAIAGLARNIEGRWQSLARSPDLLAKIEPWTSKPATQDAALRLAKALGTRTLKQWRLSPTFAASAAGGFDKVFPPEEGESATADWTPANVGKDGLIDLAAQRKPNSNVVGYALTLIEAAQEVETRLLAGSDDGLKIWLNGKLVHANNITRAAGPRQDVVAVKFQPGLNRLLVKVNQGTGGWGFFAELEDPFGALTEVSADEVAALAETKDRLDPAKLPADAELLDLKGDAARGRSVFLRATTACTRCHNIGGQGAKTTALGPALDGIGKKMGRDALLESILRPDAKVAPQWQTLTIATEDGKTFSGLLAEETGEKLTLVDAAGRRTSIAKSDIEAKKQGEQSVMPQRLVSNLSRQELADLLQFLVEQ